MSAGAGAPPPPPPNPNNNRFFWTSGAGLSYAGSSGVHQPPPSSSADQKGLKRKYDQMGQNGGGTYPGSGNPPPQWTTVPNSTSSSGSSQHFFLLPATQPNAPLPIQQQQPRSMSMRLLNQASMLRSQGQRLYLPSSGTLNVNNISTSSSNSNYSAQQYAVEAEKLRKQLESIVKMKQQLQSLKNNLVNRSMSLVNQPLTPSMMMMPAYGWQQQSHPVTAPNIRQNYQMQMSAAPAPVMNQQNPPMTIPIPYSSSQSQNYGLPVYASMMTTNQNYSNLSNNQNYQVSVPSLSMPYPSVISQGRQSQNHPPTTTIAFPTASQNQNHFAISGSTVLRPVASFAAGSQSQSTGVPSGSGAWQNNIMPGASNSQPQPRPRVVIHPPRHEVSVPRFFLPNQQRLPPPPVEAAASMPPNFEPRLENTIMSLQSHQHFSVDTISQEYKVLAGLLAPYKVTSVEQIINPDLWQRYTNTRKELLRSKSDDIALLSSLGLEDAELQQRAYISQNFVKDPMLQTAAGRYSPNEVLLFHCTREAENVERILDEGLDERLSSTNSGLLGRGIYFADDPSKSMLYDGTGGTIFIFTVILGDCLLIKDYSQMSSFVREPEKALPQMRTKNDRFFDSITARPRGYNEYVIYNRYQCCPLYKIHYQRVASPFQVPEEYNIARRSIPDMAWNPMPNQSLDGGWPLFASSLIGKMQTPEETEEELTPAEIQKKIQIVQVLLGLQDDIPRVAAAFIRCKYDLDATVNHLLEGGTPLFPLGVDLSQHKGVRYVKTILSGIQSKVRVPIGNLFNVAAAGNDPEEEDDDPSSSSEDEEETDSETETKAEVQVQQQNQAIFYAAAPKEECTICCHEYKSFSHSPQLWKEMMCCGHKLCLQCYLTIETKRGTMSGVIHTSVKCPFCQHLSGIPVGTCPYGTMTVTRIPQNCEGYPLDSSSFLIEYQLLASSAPPHHPHQIIKRFGYLPGTPEGEEILDLLRIAFDRKLIFVMGDSNTTGAQNVPVWNIHHKTSLNGGVGAHGYPDPDYLGRVRGELKSFGIE